MTKFEWLHPLSIGGTLLYALMGIIIFAMSSCISSSGSSSGYRSSGGSYGGYSSGGGHK